MYSSRGDLTECGLTKPRLDQNPRFFCIRHQRPARIIPSEIYGFAAVTESVLSELQVPLNRWGGNTASRYNWKLGNAWNTGRDWFFENVVVEDRAWEQFMDRSYRSNSRVIISLPLVGYVAKDTTSNSFSGDECQIGSYVIMMDNDYHQVEDRTKPRTSAPIILEKNVWLGVRVVVLKGVRIGENSVIGANSVVISRDIPPNCLAGGVPAWIIRTFSGQE